MVKTVGILLPEKVHFSYRFCNICICVGGMLINSLVRLVMNLRPSWQRSSPGSAIFCKKKYNRWPTQMAQNFRIESSFYSLHPYADTSYVWNLITNTLTRICFAIKLKLPHGFTGPGPCSRGPQCRAEKWTGVPITPLTNHGCKPVKVDRKINCCSRFVDLMYLR